MLKEKAKSAPRELTRRGLEGGAERLRTQLRDATQESRADGFGGDSLEDAAADGLRRAEHGAERLLKKKQSGGPAPKAQTGDAPEPRRGNAERPPIKTREAVQKEPPIPEAAGGKTPVAETAPPADGRMALTSTNNKPMIKTKDAYIQGQAATPTSQAEPPHAQGQVEFVREQGRKAARTSGIYRDGKRVPETGGGNMPPAGQRGRTSGTVRNGGDPRPPGNRSQPTTHKGRIKTRVAEHPGRQTGKAVGRSTARTVDAVGRSAGRMARAGQQAVRTRKTAKAAQVAAKKAAQAAGQALRAIASAAKSLASAIMAGGWVVIVIVLVICLVGMLVASPFGVFFSGEESGAGYSMPDAVLQLNGEFTDRIEQIKAENPYDTLDLDNAGSAAMISNWADVLAVYAVRTSMDADAPEEVATLTEEKLAILREIFWDMNDISHWVEVIPGGEDEIDTTILHITVTIKDHLQMADEYNFTADQRELLEEMMGPEYAELFLSLTGSYRDITLSPAEVREIIKKLPADLSEERRQVVLTAYQLLGKIHYFWGGKSLILGWDSRWGTPMEVWAEGSSTTGTMRPFGLDCSGMVDWVFYNATGGAYVIGHGGGASAQHSYCTDIAWSEAQPGDLVFYPGDEHVGIVCGFDESGNVLIIHCASGANNVVVTGVQGFTSIGRPAIYSE